MALLNILRYPDPRLHTVARPVDAVDDRIRRLVARSEYKRRQAPPVIRVRARAFGSGRQMPIAAQHF